jgi:hypothetical protein
VREISAPRVKIDAPPFNPMDQVEDQITGILTIDSLLIDLKGGYDDSGYYFEMSSE